MVPTKHVHIRQTRQAAVAFIVAAAATAVAGAVLITERRGILMRSIKLMTLAGVLVLPALLAASTPATAAGKAITIDGHGAGTIRLDPTTGAFAGEESGVSSRLGRYMVRLQGQASVAADGSVTGAGAATITAANGDRLTGSFTVTGQDQTQTVVMTVTGGTGRFANATGTITVICHSEPPHQDGQTLVLEHKCKMEGTLSA
jgi:hypothetical protein